MNHKHSQVSLAGLPIEILLDIFQHLDVGSIYELVLTNKFFYHLFSKRKVAILLPILAQEFSPFDELLQVYTASADDLSSTYGTLYKPRRIVFKRHAGDAGIVVSPSSSVQHLPTGQSPAHSTAGGSTVTLSEKDLRPILQHCKLIRKWEELFPSMRWFYEPENCRLLRQHEEERFRKAFYRWWLYGTYFHGSLPRPRVGLPEPYVDDIRTSHLRYYSTSELLELMDLVETVKDIILQYICPRLDPSQQSDYAYDALPELVQRKNRQNSLSRGWLGGTTWIRIIKTYAKLGPQDLMYYFENIYALSRKRLISEVHGSLPNFTFDQESIQLAIRCVLDERNWLEGAKPPSLAEDGVGGIIDFDDARDEERTVFGKDASSNGSLPFGTQVLRSQSQYSPRGDDASRLSDDPRTLWFGGAGRDSDAWGGRTSGYAAW